MSRFKEDMEIGVLLDNQIKEGVIVSVYNPISTAIVRLTTGEVVKASFETLVIPAKKEGPEPVEKEKTEEPVEKSEITITPEEFRKIACKVIAEDEKELDLPLLTLTFTIFVAKLPKALFYDNEE